MTPEAVDFTQARVDLRRAGRSAFVTPDFGAAQHRPDGVIAWNPGVQGLLGGLVDQDASGDHGGERHLDGEELIAVVSGRLVLVLLDDDGKETGRAPIEHGQAVLVPQGVWHRLVIDAPCRYLFMGGGRTELRR